MSKPEPSPDTPDVSAEKVADTAKPKKRRRSLMAMLWLGAFVVFLAAAATGAWFYAVGRTFVAPEWVKNRAEQQFSAAIPDATVSFIGMTIGIQNDWHPRILLERVQIVPDNGDTPLEFSEVETSLSYRRLLQRQVAPLDFRVSGVFLQARRESNGTLGIAIGGPGTNSDAGTDIDELIAQIDDLLLLPQFERLTDVNINAVTIQFDDVRANRSWTVDGGEMSMTRDGRDLRLSSNLALLGGRDYVSTLEFNYQSLIGSLAAKFGITVEDVVSKDIASQSPALTWLDILDAPISGALRVEIDEEGDLGPLSATFLIKEGVLQPRDGLRAVPFEAARSYFTYLPDTNTLRFDELSLISAWGTARAEGKAHLLQGEEDDLPNAMLGQFTVTEFAGNPAGLFDQPLALDKVQGDIRLTFDPFRLEIGEMLIQDQGQSLVMNGQLETTQEDWVVELNAHMDALDARRVIDWWPENAVPKTRTWVDENIFAGRITDINFALRSQPNARPDVYVDFDFEETELRYAKTLPVVKGAKGEAVLMRDRFVVKAHDGLVTPQQGGALTVSGTTLTIPDTRQKPPVGEVRLNTTGSVTAVASLLDEKPLEVFSKAKLPVDLAQGQAQVKGDINLALIKKLKAKDVAFSASALIRNVMTDHFIPGKPIQSDLLFVQADNDRVTISGAGDVAGVPFDAKWSSSLKKEEQGQSQLVGTLELGDRFSEAFELGLPTELVRGASRATMQIDFERGASPAFSAKSDLIGTRMAIPELNWVKPPGQKGELSVSGRLTKPITIDRIAVAGPGLSAEGRIALSENGGLSQATWENVRIADWFDGAANLIGRGKGRQPALEITGGRLDIANIPDRNGNATGGDAQGSAIAARLDQVVISDGITLTNMAGNFSSAGGFNGKFTGQVNGGAAVEGVIVPQNGRSAVRLRSGDAGGVFRAAGIMRQTYGGTLDLTLRPTGGEGTYDGDMSVKNIRVREAPAMAALLNAISVVGLLEQLGGEGIAFADVSAEFRLSPGGITLTQGSAAGPSMGLSADGTYRFDNKQLQMQGVISPLYLLNVVGRPIARKGEGLFGFNYQLGGTSDDPKVRVNPLSVLTPGFMRDIFRRPTAPVPESAPETPSQ